eukprot:419919_1
MIFRVTVIGIFIPIGVLDDTFGREFNDIFVIAPKSVKMEYDYTNLKQAVSELHNVLQFDKVIDDNSLMQFENNLKKVKCLLTNSLFGELVSQHHDANEEKINMLYDFVMNKDINVLSRILVNLPIINVNINMKELYSMIWVDFINNNDIDNMAIIKLRHTCQEIEQQSTETEEQIPGKVLLEYKVNDFLNQIHEDINHIKWKKHIDIYIVNNITPFNFNRQQTDIVVSERQITEKEKVQKFIDIMSKYEQIMNQKQKHNHQEEEKQIVIVISSAAKSLFDMSKLDKLVDLIDKEMPMPQLMDVLFDIKHKKIEDSDKIMKNHECKLRHDCNI